MYDIAGKVWAFLFAIFIIFTGSTMLYAQKQDTIVQSYVDSAVEEFVDTSRARGYVAQNTYEEFISKLDATQNVYDVNMTHYSERQAPVTKGDTKDYESYYEAYTQDDILSTIYDQATTESTARYDMKTGDFLRVEVKNTSPTLGRRLLGMFTGNSSEGGQIVSSYGGYVGNEN